MTDCFSYKLSKKTHRATPPDGVRPSLPRLHAATVSKRFKAKCCGNDAKNRLEKVRILRIRQMCATHPCMPPHIEADDDWYRIIFRRPGDESRPESRPESRSESRLASRLESLLAAKILMLLAQEETGKSAMAQYLGHKTVSGELHKQIKRLLASGLITMTNPEKPNSRLQKYRLTAKGKELLADLPHPEEDQ
jgi:hypothetical protein